LGKGMRMIFQNLASQDGGFLAELQKKGLNDLPSPQPPTSCP